MMRWRVAVLAMIGILVIATVSTAAAVQAPATRVVVGGHVHLRAGHAVLQRAQGKHWTKVRRVMVRRHRFSAPATQRSVVARYRIATAHWHSRDFVVRAGDGSSASKSQIAGTGSKAAPTCGAPLTKADGTPWTCTFDDEFDGTALDRSKWAVQTDFVTGTASAYACDEDSPNNVSVSGGALNLTVRKESTPVACEDDKYGATSQYSAGSVMTYHLFSQQYGRFEARVKPAAAPKVPGLQESFWLWPDDRYSSTMTYPLSGEIDIAETYSEFPDLAVPFLHYGALGAVGPIQGVNTSQTCAAQRGVYNTYTLTWSATQIEIDVNGVKCLVNNSGDPAFKKPYIMLLTSLLGEGNNKPTDKTPLPATTRVDYVRVWK